MTESSEIPETTPLEASKETKQEGTFFWNLYGRCYDSIYHLMPYRKLLWDVLQALDLKPGMKILDAGCGTGNFELFTSEKNIPPVQIEAIDFSPVMLSRAINKCNSLNYINFKLADLNQRLTYPGNTFDRILCLNVLHSLENRLFSLRELFRLLKSHGKIVIVDPKPDSKTVPVLRDHFERIGNIWGLPRKLSMLTKTVVFLPIPITLMPILDFFTEDRNNRKQKKYYFFPENKFAAMLKQNNFRIVDVDSVYTDQDWFISAVKIVSDGAQLCGTPAEILTQYSTGLGLYPSREGPVMNSPNLQLLNLDELPNDPIVLDQLVRTYREIFGSPDIWGEGAYCDLNPKHLVSLPEYERRLQSGNLECGCGGTFQPCYQPEKLRDKITYQLIPTRDKKPFCVIMWDKNRIQGFIWGVVTPLTACLERIAHSRYYNSNEQWEKQIEKLSVILNKQGLDPDDDLLFIDELAIMPEARRGITPLLSLVRRCFEHAFKHECQRVLFWTSLYSPIHKFALLAGFQEILTTPDGIVFLFCNDVIPILILLQNREPDKILPIVLSAARNFKNLVNQKVHRKH